MSRVEKENYPNFLCDTWWYGLTQRLSDRKFEELARLRAKQGFSAVQLVVGIPPEVGPENPNAASKIGPAWNLQGEFNEQYLDYARQRITFLNSVGLSVLVYGAWGQQIEWLGVEKMQDWWKKIVEKVDDLDVMYCLTGESDIWVGEEDKLLPGKTTEELNTVRLIPFLHPRLVYLAKRIVTAIADLLNQSKKTERRGKWSQVLSGVSVLTNKPIFIHVLSGITSQEAVNNPKLLSATTVQTGHDPNSRRLLWQLPFKTTTENSNSNFINLEPWYEGITNRFGVEDQLYAYWASMMGGADAYCYGAHGIWNAGDGKFLSHWGKQTLDQAMRLETPKLIGISHKLFTESRFKDLKNIEIEAPMEELIRITRTDNRSQFVNFFPEVSLVKNLPEGNIFSPLKGEFIKIPPKTGPVVIISPK
ncbi:MAG: DUF4038 domain-containing protein [Candidatus Daviesbacteria bacterium]|nr:MAG: DUF4038 domain-containing protein [Candidatus Daviesbacteria bacterium]